MWIVLLEEIGSRSESSGVQHVLSLFEDFDLAFDFIEKRKKDRKFDMNPNLRYRLVSGKLHDSAYVKIANGEIIDW
jgi:hypothetical protein